jgi:hypothetical protein
MSDEVCNKCDKTDISEINFLCDECLKIDIEKARKRGAVEEQKKELVFLNKLQERLNGYHCGYHEQLNKMINNRKKELKEKEGV